MGSGLRGCNNFGGHEPRKGVNEFLDIDIGNSRGHQGTIKGAIQTLNFIYFQIDFHNLFGRHWLVGQWLLHSIEQSGQTLSLGWLYATLLDCRLSRRLHTLLLLHINAPFPVRRIFRFYVLGLIFPTYLD